jgi:hypothetical protein
VSDSVDRDSQVADIAAGLMSLLTGKDKQCTIVAAISIAVSSARMVGMNKIELQKLLVRCYDRQELANEVSRG